jgi:ribonuclease E
VNSGRATRERHIEETAFKTNLEAAEEVARQLRLRDLAGLIVIDFIDMEEDRNNEAVERRLKDAMRHDRARVQVGKMSPFGLLELSRQRLRPNIIESTSLPCVACHGSGMVRSVESSSLHILRGIEEEAIQQKASTLAVYVPTSIALYILNYKRTVLQNIENKWSVSVQFSKDDTLIPPEFRIERLQLRKDAAARESVREERMPEAPSSAPRPPERRPHAKRPQKFEHKPTEQIKQIPEEAVPLPEPSTSEKEGTNKPRRRFRKYDRRHRSKQGQPSAEAGSAETTPIASPSSSSQNETAPAPIKVDLPKKNNDNVEIRAASPATKEPQTSTPPKKASTRKGWWQKLLD